jgi:threonylcarbamoyladenosine tRNA methylthiotransferase MtaB
MRRENKKVAIITLGCRVNQSESSVIEGTLKENGVTIVGINEKPDYCVINTCTVTGRSDANSRQYIRRAYKTGAQIIVTGCYSELNRNEVCSLWKNCIVIPSADKEKIIGHILGFDVDTLYNFHDRARPYLKVQDGCNFRCSYCAVPLARGKSTSLSVQEAVRRAAGIAEKGFKELVLTGIHLGSYGRDLDASINLSHLIKEILLSTDIGRIRLSSIEINEIDDELIELLSHPRVCNHLHLPLQSGSDRILRLMKRNYSAGSFRDLLIRISKNTENMAFGTDIIVGFPTETEEDFLFSFELLQELPFSYLHIFPYSERSGTDAAKMTPHISSRIIRQRTDSLMQLNNDKKKIYALKQSGHVLGVIAEEQDRFCNLSGTANNYLKIQFKATGLQRGSLVFVRIDDKNEGLLNASVISSL